MSAELLREAAAEMRERAQAARVWDGRWKVASDHPARVIEDKQSNGWDNALIAKCVDYVGTENGEEQAEHIASWHPAVALAVADWLDLVAEDCEFDDSPAYVGAASCVARTYLGGVA